MNLTDSDTCVDVRGAAPQERRLRVLNVFRKLQGGEVMEIVNDHDPRPLYYQMQEERPGLFAWDDLETGPDTWRVRITGLASAGTDGGRCCGACGGV